MQRLVVRPRWLRAPRRRDALAALLALGCAALLPGALRAQNTGAIEGTVTTAPPRGAPRPLDSVRVTIVGTSRATTTDARGHFRLGGLVAGAYDVVAARAGYRAVQRHAVVSAGAAAMVDIVLPEGSMLLAPVVVSAARAPERGTETAATINTLSPEQVRTSPARTTDDLLRELPGLELPRTSSTVSGAEEIVSIRGVDEGRTLVLADGVPLNDPWGEWIQWNRVPRQSVDRVEVLEGGGSSLYGNYAMGGVIQLFSRPITQRGYELTASGGSRGTAEVSGYGSSVRGPWGASLGVDYGTGGGYTLLSADQRGPVDQRSDVTRWNVTGRVERAVADGALFATGSYFTDDRSLGTPLTALNSRRITSGTVGGDLGGIGGGRLRFDLFGQVQRYASPQTVVSADRASERLAIAQRIPSQGLGGSVQWSRAAGRFTSLSIGGDARYMHGRLDEAVYDTSGALAGPRSSGGSELTGGVFVQGVLAPTEALRIEASVRADAWRSYDGGKWDRSGGTPADTMYAARRDEALSPRLGVRYALTPALTVRSSVYRAFRAPTLSEEYRTFYSGPNTFLGTPGLGPEHLTGVDAGLDWRAASRVELRVTAFWNEMRDLMTFVFQGPSPAGGAILQRENVGGARSRGGEAELALRLLEPLTLSASYEYDDARITRASNPAQLGTFVARVPLQQASARLAWSSTALGTVTAIYRYEGPANSISGARMGSYSLVDLDARHALAAGVDAFVAVENLFDASYTVNVAGPLDYLGLPRTVRAGLSLRSF